MKPGDAVYIRGQPTSFYARWKGQLAVVSEVHDDHAYVRSNRDGLLTMCPLPLAILEVRHVDGECVLCDQRAYARALCLRHYGNWSSRERYRRRKALR